MSNVFDRVFVTSNDLELLNHYLTSVKYSESVNDTLRHTVFRVNTLSSTNNVDSFIIRTIADTLDTITYTSSADVVNLNEIRDAGYF